MTNHQPQTDPLLRDLAYPSELQVLSRHDPLDQAKADRFWLHWENAPERAKRLPQYWRFAGYVRSDAATTPEDLSDAQAHFQKGLECNPSAQQRAALDVAIAQVEWLRILTLLDSDVPLDDEQVAGLLFQLAVDAEQLADRCSLSPPLGWPLSATLGHSRARSRRKRRAAAAAPGRLTTSPEKTMCSFWSSWFVIAASCLNCK